MNSLLNMKSEAKVNVTSVTNLNVNDKDIKVSYDVNPMNELAVKQLEAKVQSLDALCQVQKLVIQMMMDNPLRVKDYIVADDVVLARLIQLLTNAETVEIDAEDIGSGCFTPHVYRKVKDIYAISDNGEVVTNVKYTRPDVIKTLRDLRISTKYVY